MKAIVQTEGSAEAVKARADIGGGGRNGDSDRGRHESRVFWGSVFRRKHVKAFEKKTFEKKSVLKNVSKRSVSSKGKQY